MSDYSMELAAERITDARTRRYFSEVMSCYNSGCYRSAVVMLWSVVITDILLKLVQLSDHYGDEVAKEILEDIKAARTKDARSPAWEWHLVKEVNTKTELLEVGDFANLEALQKHRHLSAHPVLDAAEVLFEPNRETTRAHIRNALEGILTKPAFMTKQVYDTFVEDLEANANIFPDAANLSKYLSAKYFSHMVPAVELALFRNLWRAVFRSEDPRCEANREIIFRALVILYERRRDHFKTTVAAERDYFSEVGLQGSRFEMLVRFIGTHPELFSVLTDAARTPLIAAGDRDLSSFAVCAFLSKGAREHIEAVHERIRRGESITGAAFADLVETAEAAGLKGDVLPLAVTQFGMSKSTSAADASFTALIIPFLRDFSKTHLTDLVKAVNENKQIYGRGRAVRDHRLIREAVDAAFNGSFDFSPYPRFD